MWDCLGSIICVFWSGARCWRGSYRCWSCHRIGRSDVSWASLHLTVAQQLVEVQRQMRQRIWEAANVKLRSVTLHTDTTVHTVYELVRRT